MIDGDFKVYYDPLPLVLPEEATLDSDSDEDLDDLLPFHLPLPAPQFDALPLIDFPPNPFAAVPLAPMEVIPNPFAMSVPASMDTSVGGVGGGVMNMLPNPFDHFPNPFAMPSILPIPLPITTPVQPIASTSMVNDTVIDKGKGKEKEVRPVRPRKIRVRRKNELALMAEFLPPLPPKHSYRTTPVRPVLRHLKKEELTTINRSFPVLHLLPLFHHQPQRSFNFPLYPLSPIYQLSDLDSPILKRSPIL